MIVALLFASVPIHVLFVIFRHRGEFRARMQSLIGAIGLVCQAFLITIVSMVLAPFQCHSHPNDLDTVLKYPTVVCWDGNSHSTMVAIGAMATTIPVIFISVCIYAVLKLPGRLCKGDTQFLNMFSFLFFRFRPEANWYVLVFLARNMIVALVPILPDAAAQILTMLFVVSLCTGLSIHIWPWRVSVANLFEIGAGMGVGAILCVSLAFVGEVDVGGAGCSRTAL